MKTNQPFVYIVILNWNGYEDTQECLESLEKIIYENFKILIIDNGSIYDDFSKLVKLTKKNSKIIIHKNEKNLGFAGGVNVGIKKSLASKTEYTLLLNNDVIVDKNFLNELINVAQKNEQVGIVGSKIFYYDHPQKVWDNGSFFNYYFPPLSRKYEKDLPGVVTDIVGCCMLIKNKLFESVGIFDEEYFAYGEESDFNFRTIKAGYKIYIAPSSHIFHKISKSTGGGFNKTVAYLKMRNKIKYAKKNYPIQYWPSYLVFLMLYFIKEEIKSILFRKYDVSDALLRGVRDAI